MNSMVEVIRDLADAIREKNSDSPWIDSDKKAIAYLPFGRTVFYELKKNAEIPYRTLVDQGIAIDFYDKRELDEWLESYSSKIGGK
ncbi:hypothetical protein ACJQWY_02390 [Weissella kandleri]|uniref:hypothetical protein n=1 Tax=Weissella kandleri TaxID=1616 RepID=UPI00387E2608